MKAAAFSFAVAETLHAASAALAAGARPMAGGQSLGPMLNLRLAQPHAVVGLDRLPELSGASETATHIILGAAVTHAQIEDGATPDIGTGILARIAAGIAYRAVRNRGTIGGSLCHADPAADWVTTLLALNAEAVTFAQTGGRAIALRDFFAGAFRTVLAPGEFLRAIKIPKLRSDESFGYYKSCRKPGEFAHAMAAVFRAPDARRVVIGALGTIPVRLEGAEAEPAAIATALRSQAPGLDEIAMHMQLIAVKRAFESLAP
jgi:carbon-monoxide dehydrogenase medium subunit